MIRLILIGLIFYASHVLGQPEYHLTIGLNYSDFYGYLDVDRSVYRELQTTFAEKASLRAGIELNGDINTIFSYRSGITYRGTGTTGYDMHVLSMPVLLLLRTGGLKFGGGFSPSIILNTPPYDNRQYNFPIHFLVSFRVLDRLHVSVGHLRQLNTVVTVNSDNFTSGRIIPEVDMRLHETYLNLSYRMF